VRHKSNDRQRLTVALLFCLALAHGLLYTFVVPPWQHYDEPTHFEYAWLIANRRMLPQVGDYDQKMRREVAASMVEHGFFRDLAFEPDMLAQDKPIWLGASELPHPPFYYLLLAVPLRFIRHADVTFQLYVARLISLFLHLFSVWIGYRLAGELVAPGHPLRWAVPGMMALLPAYTDLMTAVNNDVGAVVLFSLFLWGAVCTIVRGVTLFHLAWVVGTSALCVYTKSTVSVAVVFVPITLTLALSHRGWKWRGRIVLLLAGLLLTPLLFSWGDAALWQRNTLQTAPTSRRVTDAPVGQRAIALEVAPDKSSQQVIQFLPRKDIETLQGMTVTLGAWVWASLPAQVYLPGLHDGQWHRRQAMQVDVAPSFHALTTTVSADAVDIRVALRPSPNSTPGEGVVVYYDGVILVEGEWPLDTPPSFHDDNGREGTWQGQPFVNRIRNGSAEATWPFMRSWADSALLKYTRRPPSQSLASILDWERTAWVYRSVAVNLLQSFWARFGWNHVGLHEGGYWGLGVVTIVGAVGAIVGGAQLWRSGRVRVRRAGESPSTRKAIALLALAGLAVWVSTFLRPHPLVGRPFVPVARYAYPAIIPSVLALLGGWWTITPERLRRWFLWGMFSLLGSLDIVSLWTLWSFYYGG